MQRLGRAVGGERCGLAAVDPRAAAGLTANLDEAHVLKGQKIVVHGDAALARRGSRAFFAFATGSSEVRAW